jgi:hypothetical protein
MFLTKDLPAYDSTNIVAVDSWVTKQQSSSTSTDTAPIRLPLLTGKKGMWNWLQPYAVDGGSGGSQVTKYNAFEVGVNGEFTFLRLGSSGDVNVCPQMDVFGWILDRILWRRAFCSWLNLLLTNSIMKI